MSEQNNKKLKVVSVVLGLLVAACVAAVAFLGFGPVGNAANAADGDAEKTTLSAAAPQEGETATKTEISIGTAQATGVTDKKDDTKDTNTTTTKKSTTSSTSSNKSTSTSGSSSSNKNPSSSNGGNSNPVEQKPVDNPEQNNGSTTDVLSQDYIFPDSDSRILTDADIAGMSAKELNYAKNEIYARHGRIFDSTELANYFKSKSWYEGTRSPDDFDESLLSETEKKNIEFLKNAEYALEPGGYQPS